MSSSKPGLESVKKCTPTLEKAFKGYDRNLVQFLVQAGFITPSLSEDVLNLKSMLSKSDKAGMLVDAIKDAVDLEDERFHTLVNKLNKCGAFYAPVVKALKREYVAFGGVLVEEKQAAPTTPLDTTVSSSTSDDTGMIRDFSSSQKIK